jgi:glutathione S-transferase
MELALAGRSYLAGAFSYADIAFYMAQFFAARHTVPMTASCPNLLVWRSRMAQRPAVKTVIGAMVNYLRRLNLPIPEFGEREDAR